MSGLKTLMRRGIVPPLIHGMLVYPPAAFERQMRDQESMALRMAA
jgi:hypothetical protein